MLSFPKLSGLWLSLLWLLACATFAHAADPGVAFPAASIASEQKAGSVLIYNYYTSSATNSIQQNTRFTVTNTHETASVFVHLFFIAANGTVADSFISLAPNQMGSFLASDVDPAISGYMVAVATNSQGCPLSHNFLLGSAQIKLNTGHSAKLTAVAIAARFSGVLPGCTGSSATATLAFDSSAGGYDQVPRVLSLNNIRSNADDNSTLLIVNRIGGNLGVGAGTIGTLFGLLNDDAENVFSFSISGSSQFTSLFSDSFPRTIPRFTIVIPAGRSGWMKIYHQTLDIGLLGAVIQYNPRTTGASASAIAYNGGQNLHALALATAASFTIPLFSNLPLITSLNPAAASAGSAGFTLTISGSNFSNSSVVQWNGNSRATAFSSGTQLTAQIPASDLVAAGTANVTVFNPPPGGGTSNSLSFTINSAIACPVVSSINPASGIVGSSVTITGANFTGVTAVKFATNVASTFSINSDSQITATVPSGAVTGSITLSKTGCADVQTATFTVTQPNPVPTLTSISPNSVTAGSAAFTLTVNGTNFVSGAVVRWNGSNRATSFVSSARLSATITAADISTAGTASVTVFNPAPGGGASNALSFTVCSYAIQPTNQSFNASGGSGSVNVTAGSGCAWAATSNASWITVTSSASGSGNGTVSYSVAANPNTSQRSGTLTIAGQTFTISQAGAINAPTITSISPPTPTISVQDRPIVVNGSGFQSGLTVTVFYPGGQSTLSGSQIQNVTSTSFVMLVLLSLPGGYGIRVNNPDGGQSDIFNFTVVSCSFTLGALNQSFSANGGTGSVSVTTASGCQWVAASNVNWITITAGSVSVGSGTVEFLVAANTNASSRSGTLTIANQTFTVNQAGIAPNPSPTLTSLNPNSVITGSGALTLAVNGANFFSGSAVRWNGSDRATAFISSTQLTAQILATDIATAGTATITVFNPAPGGGVSNALSVTINPAPVGFIISGKVTYASNERAVPGVVVTAESPVSGAKLTSLPSSNDGAYAVTGLAGGFYFVTPTKTGQANGITAFDAARIAQHAAGQLLTGAARQAADVDGDGEVTRADAVQVLNQVIGGPGSGQAGNWRLFGSRLELNVTGNVPNQILRMLLLGVVSGNWTADSAPTITALAPVNLSLRQEMNGSRVNVRGVTIVGRGFAPGMTLVLSLPDVGEIRLIGASLQNVTDSSFTALFSLDAPGVWALQVIHPDGRRSETVAVKLP